MGMLFIMTYSLELFIFSIAGLVAGHMLVELEQDDSGAPCCRLARGPDFVAPDVAVLAVTGMTCQACTHTVRRCLEGEEGVLRATIDLEGRKATVMFQAPANIASMSEALDDIGF